MTVKAKINGELITFRDHSQFFAYILLLVDTVSPFEVLKENIIKAYELRNEFSPRISEKTLKYLHSIDNKDYLLRFYFDVILNMERLGLLWGFSVVTPIGKGDTFYNPERKRISTNHEKDG